MRKKHQLTYAIKIINKKTNLFIRELTFTNREEAYKQLNFYNATLNLRAEMEIYN